MKEIEYKFILKPADKTRLEKYLKANHAKLVKQGVQLNFYYVAPGKLDLRIRQTDHEAYLILKHGWMHSACRDEIEVKVARSDFGSLDKILSALGYKYDTKWYRKRTEYKLHNFNVTIDFNAGYGWICEIERVVKKDANKAKGEILQFAKLIGIKPTNQKLFDKMYRFYKKNWQHYYDSKTTFDIDALK